MNVILSKMGLIFGALMVLVGGLSVAHGSEYLFTPHSLVDGCGCGENIQVKCSRTGSSIKLKATEFAEANKEFEKLCSETQYVSGEHCRCVPGYDEYGDRRYPYAECEVDEAKLGIMMYDGAPGPYVNTSINGGSIFCE